MSKHLWQDLFRNQYTVPVVVEHTSGSTVQTADVRGIIIEAWDLQRDQFPHAAVKCTLILPPGDFPICPGDRVTCRGETWDIAGVEICKTLSGEVIARRCSIVN